jgi:hypothetical protein
MTTDQPEDQRNQTKDNGEERAQATPPPEGTGAHAETG